ncbi:DUF5996 family protein [Cnuibacter physcomitrellae]|uniref:DUF5996 family protein n=1 Tax=Cnuibacter physcomitrellae TaxID=1619308 RepID=UPI002175D7D5|nr:DUF5996 family protein [Cnuibacter physcomitrellae]MCS5498133.1 DUF5996 family protein [Cnuibacter physcomitrellae]
MSETSATTEAWPALRVDEWTATRETLHLWTQVVGKVRMALAAPINHWWHVSLQVTARGLATGLMPAHAAGGEGGELEIEFDLLAHELVLRSSDGRRVSFPLSGLSVADFYIAVLESLDRLGVAVSIRPVPNEVEVAIPFPDDTVHHTYVPEHATAFWRQLVQADRILRRFRSSFTGKVSPVHFFWGAMDLAVTRFSGRPAPTHPGGAPHCPDWVMHEGYSHELSSAGFWPGGGEEGAFYSYAYPAPEGFAAAPVPDGAFFSDTFGEFLLPWETVRTAADPDALVLSFLEATYDAAASRADWPPLTRRW